MKIYLFFALIFAFLFIRDLHTKAEINSEISNKKNNIEIDKLNLEINNIEIDNIYLNENKKSLIIEKLKINNVEDYYINKFLEFYNKDINLCFNTLIKFVNVNPINIYENFLTNNECDKLIELSNKRFIDSRVNNNSKQVNNNIRSSHSAFYKTSENEFIISIEKRIAQLLYINVNNLENLQVSKYNKYGFYKLHHDFFSNNINQRKYSIIIYLTDLQQGEGGETHFPLYNIKVTPSKGKLIYFDNLFFNNIVNTLTIHESLQILCDKSKYVLVTWSRLFNLH